LATFAALVAPAAFEARADPMFVNPSFEAPNVAGQPGGFQVNPPGAGWTFNAGSGEAANGSAFTDGQPAPNGNQVAFLQAQGSQFSQTATNFQFLGFYTVNFFAAQRGNNPPIQPPSQQNFTVMIDGNTVGTFTPAGTTYTAFSTTPLLLTPGSHLVTFTGLGQNNPALDVTAFVDLVTITQVGVPEPASLVLAAVGSLGLLGLARRRRACPAS
jgi:hypothetical protein